MAPQHEAPCYHGAPGWGAMPQRNLVRSFLIQRPTVHVTVLFTRDMPEACHLIRVRGEGAIRVM